MPIAIVLNVCITIHMVALMSPSWCLENNVAAVGTHTRPDTMAAAPSDSEGIAANMDWCCDCPMIFFAGPAPPSETCESEAAESTYNAFFGAGPGCEPTHAVFKGHLISDGETFTLRMEEGCGPLPVMYVQTVPFTEEINSEGGSECCTNLWPIGPAQITGMDGDSSIFGHEEGVVSIRSGALRSKAGDVHTATFDVSVPSNPHACGPGCANASFTVRLEVIASDCGGCCSGPQERSATNGVPPSVTSGTATFQPRLVGDVDQGVAFVRHVIVDNEFMSDVFEQHHVKLPDLGSFAIEDALPTEFVNLATSTFVPSTGSGTYNVKVILQDPSLEFVFEDTRSGAQWEDQESWSGTTIPLKWIRRIKSTGLTEDLVEGTRVQAGNRFVPLKWMSGANNALSLDFEYDGSNLLSKVTASDGKTVNTTYERTEVIVPYDGFDLTREYVLLKHVDSNCGSCPSYDYEYDGLGRLTKVLDPDDNVLRGMGYASIEGYGDRVLTKVYRQPDGGSEQLMFSAIYDGAAYKATKYTYQSNALTQVVVDEHLSGFGRVTKRHEYATVNPSLAGGGDQYSFLLYRNGSNVLTRVDEAFPRGNTHRRYIGTSGDGAGQATADVVYNGTNEITLVEYEYDIVDSRTVVVSTTDVRGSETTNEFEPPEYSSGVGLLTRSIEPVVGTILGNVQQTRSYTYNNKWFMTNEVTNTVGGDMTRKYQHDDFGNLTQMTEDHGGLALVSDYVYDSANRLSIHEDPRGYSRVSKYLTSGSLDREYALDFATGDAFSLVVYVYDDMGRVTKVRTAKEDGLIDDPDNYSSNFVDTGYRYDAVGLQTAMIEDEGGLNLTTTYEYDHQDRVIKTTTPSGVFTQIERDGRGRLHRQIVGAAGGNNLTTTYEYDGNSNLTRVTEPGGTMMTYDYDLYDRRTKATRSSS